MSKALGFISVHRYDLVSHFFESLYFTEDKVIVLRIAKVELKKFGLGAIIKILTNKKKYSWDARGLPDVKKPKFDDYEEVLWRVFSEKLLVKR